MGLTFNHTVPVVPVLRAGSEDTHKLFPGQTLRIVADAQSSGHVLQLETNPGEPRPNTRTEVPADQTTTIGPFDEQRCFRVLCDLGAITVTLVGQRKPGD